MSTSYTLDATTAMPRVRRASSSLEPRTAESSQRYMRPFAKIVLISAASVIAVSALLAIHVENPGRKDRGCIISANPHHSLAHPDFSSSSIDRVTHAHDLPILRWPIDTDWIPTNYCDQSLEGRSSASQIQR